MDRFLHIKYYFTAIPDPNFQFTKLVLIIGLLLIIGGFAVTYYRKKVAKDQIVKKLIKKYPTLLKIYGFITLILLLIREAGIPYISMRIWWVVLAGFFFYSLIKFLTTFKKNYSKRLHKSIKNAKNNKYLPRKKH